jgi:hypothetical protein
MIDAQARRHPAPKSSATPWKFALWTLIAAAVAATAAWASAALALEVWVMFAGFIAWFTRPATRADGSAALLCLWLGVGLGALSHLATVFLMPELGHLALPLVVFAVAILIVGLRTHRILGNMLAWFLGLVTFFAAEPVLAAAPLLTIVVTSAIGGLAGYTCQALNRRFAE